MVPVLLFLALLMTIMFLDITNLLAHQFLPDSVTLDWILSMLHVELKLSASDLVYAVWTAVSASLVPKLWQVGTFTLLMFSYLAIEWSILKKHPRLRIYIGRLVRSRPIFDFVGWFYRQFRGYISRWR